MNSLSNIFSLAVIFCLIFTNSLFAEVDQQLKPKYFGQKISKISFLTSSNLSWEDLASKTDLNLGDTLTEESLAQAVLVLESRGVFSKVETGLESYKEGVLVKFFLHPKALISKVFFEGASGIERAKLESLAATIRGELVADENLKKFGTSLVSLLESEGYRGYNLGLSIDADPESHYAEVTALIEGKVRQSIEQIVFTQSIADEVRPRIESVINQFIDDSVSSYNLELLRQGILIACREEGYLQANIEDVKIVEKNTEGAIVEVSLNVGEPISIVFRGNESFSPEELLGPLGIRTRKVPFAPTAVKSLERKIVDLYHKQGFFRVSTSLSELPVRGVRKVYEFTIDEGVRYKSLPVQFTGNESFSSEKLSEYFRSLIRPGLLSSFMESPPVSQSSLQGELEAMLDYYRSQGFFSAEGSLSFEIEDTYIRPRVTIIEGERFSLKGVRLDLEGMGSSSFIDQESLPLINLKSLIRAGDYYNSENVENERRRIQDEILALGYPVAKVKAGLDLDGGYLVFRIDPGLKVQVGTISIAGNLHTHDQVISRSLRIREGDPWTTSKVKESRKSLFKLGHFRKVNLQPVDEIFDSAVEDMVVRVAERETGRFSAGVGFHSEDGLRLLGEVRQGNLFGNGNSARLGFDAYINEGPRVVDAGNARALYRVPNLLGTDLELLIEAFFRFQIQLIDQFSYDRSGGSVGISWPISERLKLRTGIEAYYEEVFDVLDDVEISENDSGSAIFSFANLELDYDFRNEQFNPSQGGRTQLAFALSGQALGSDITFGRISAKQSFFFELWRSVVLAVNGRGEFLIPFESGEPIPISQRIFLGGRNSLRGFRLSSIGPRGFENNAVGGDSSLVFNAELQFDLTENISGALFLDAGQAFLDNEGSFSGESTDLGDLRYSPGLSLRYKTPIGPISLDYGLALNRKEGEDFGRFHVGIGLIF